MTRFKSLYIRFSLLLFLSILISGNLLAQKKVAIVSFYLDREVDFSLMQAFNDDSEDKIKKLMKDPEFDLAPMITDFHTFIVEEILPQAPFTLTDEKLVFNSNNYKALEPSIDKEETELHQPYPGYLPLGKDLKNDYLKVSTDNSADGIMLANLTFFVRKNGLKTVIMAQVELDIRNNEGKRAWKYLEFGLSPMGITTFSGFIVSNQDEIMPMFTSAVENLKEKVQANFAKRAIKSTKKL